MKKNTNELSNELINLMNLQMIHDRQYNLPIPNLWRCESCQVIFQVRGNDNLPYIFKDNFGHEGELLCKQCYGFASSLISRYKMIADEREIVGIIHWRQYDYTKDSYFLTVDFLTQSSEPDRITLPPVTGKLKYEVRPSKIFESLIKKSL